MSEKIYGRKPVLEALKSGIRAVSQLFILQGSRDEVLNQIEAHAKAKGVPITLETRRRLDALAGNDHHQGIVAVAESFKYADLQDLLDKGKVLGEPTFIILLDEIEDPQNLGAIIRSADAAGAHGVVIPKHHAVEVNATAIKASAGAAEHIPTVKVTNLNDAIQRLKDANVWVVGADGEAKKNFYEYDYRSPVALVIGNEGKGLRRLVRENCDELVKIPMAGKMSSLNASVASALLLFEVARQRKWGKRAAAALTGPASPVPAHSPVVSPEIIEGYPPIPDGYPSVVSNPLETVGSPPERDFFRPGPDPVVEAPDEGLTQGTEMSPADPLGPSTDGPGRDKGGGFHW